MTQADEIVRLVLDALGPDLIGAYAHGSAVLGGLRTRSDLDVLAVTRRPLTSRQRRSLAQGLLAVSGTGARSDQRRPVELMIVVQSEVRPWRYPPRLEFLYGEWLRDDFQHGRIAPPGPSADLAPLITMTLQGNRPLFGPPPAEVLDAVPHEDLLEGVVAGVPGLLLDLDTDTRNVVLTLARVWVTVATGSILSKDAAADWTIARLPEEHRAVPARARAIYLGEAEEGWDDLRDRVRPYADHVVAAIDEAAAGG
jgi:predicted nucleotidyltransferase